MNQNLYHAFTRGIEQLPGVAKRGRGRVVVIVALVVVLVAVGLYFWRNSSTPQQPSMMTSLVKRGDVEVTVLATGELKPIKLVAVGAQVSGRITSIKVAIGDKVTSGQLIAEIDAATKENDLKSEQAALAYVRAQKAEKEATLVLNQQTLDRQRKMVAQRAVSQADYQTAEADLEVTKAQIAALNAQIDEAQVAVDTAQVNLGYTKITAPITGAVLAIVSQEGQTVNATQSTPTIVVLGEIDTMTIRAEISEVDVVKTKPGQQAYFTLLGDSDRKFTATLELINPAPDSIRNDSSFSSSSSSASSSSSSSGSSEEAIYYYGIFNVPNPDGLLKTYMTAEMHIVLGEAKNVLTIPTAALHKATDGSYTVQVVDNRQKVTSRAVEIGLNDKAEVEVKSGLKEGERVAIGELSSNSSTSSSQGGPPSAMGF